ncbi:cytochrome c [Alcaligenes faecalis]|uniref:c-type cytochrome n=1 Tax=Alcaligenes faecalis TaxID=511 RepID=UPI001C83532B|nr:cytochrome c [Alcaligenes faecalis]MBX6963625.1 cytochrome c [Providencia rettgeri]MBX7030275.1 cytochrome c [Alcaligenes faecalis]
MNGLRLPLKLCGKQALSKIWFALLLSLLWPQQTTADEVALSLERQASLRTLLHQECGSCHGLLLKGGLGPALTADTLRGQSAEQISLTIMHGRPGTAMPAWNRFLQPAESLWLANFLLHETDAAP